MTTFYEVLGVPADASPAQIRRAYVTLARTYHPDFHTTATPAVRAANERAMQAVNEAWAVLSDPTARRRYDVRGAGSANGGGDSPWAQDHGAAGDHARRAARREARAREYEQDRSSWRPFESDGHDPIDPRLHDDEPSRVTVSLGKQVAMVLPTLTFLIGVALVFLGLVVNLLPVSVLGIATIVGSAVAFLVLPLFELSASARNDRR